MRQAGYLAAAGLYALEHNIQRLRIDHNHATAIAHALIKKEFIGRMLPVETNILIFEVTGKYSAASFTDYLKQHDILCIAISPTQVRMVTHLDITAEMTQKLLNIIAEM